MRSRALLKTLLSIKSLRTVCSLTTMIFTSTEMNMKTRVCSCLQSTTSQSLDVYITQQIETKLQERPQKWQERKLMTISICQSINKPSNSTNSTSTDIFEGELCFKIIVKNAAILLLWQINERLRPILSSKLISATKITRKALRLDPLSLMQRSNFQCKFFLSQPFNQI